MHRHYTIQFMNTLCIIILQTFLATELWAREEKRAPAGGHKDGESIWDTMLNTVVFICIVAIPFLHIFIIFALIVVVVHFIRLKCNASQLNEDDNSMITCDKHHQFAQDGDIYNV